MGHSQGDHFAEKKKKKPTPLGLFGVILPNPGGLQGCCRKGTFPYSCWGEKTKHKEWGYNWSLFQASSPNTDTSL